ncbi:50S ribosomal protein L29 [Candidatus Uhrbacteria bacterium]|nr:50S ribosomal protein L29 [Candidatus Uhrbacteria bacterium]
MDAKELRLKTREELMALVAELTGDARDLKSSVRTRQTRNVRDLRTKKRTLARIHTILRELAAKSNV